MSPNEYRAFADTAFEDAQEYRDMAEIATDPVKRARYLKWADNRESDGCFYIGLAVMAEQHEETRNVA